MALGLAHMIVDSTAVAENMLDMMLRMMVVPLVIRLTYLELHQSMNPLYKQKQ